MANDQGQDRHLCHRVNFPKGLPKDASPVHLEPNRLPVLLKYKDDFNTHPKNGPAEKVRLLRDTCSFSLYLSNPPSEKTFVFQAAQTCGSI